MMLHYLRLNFFKVAEKYLSIGPQYRQLSSGTMTHIGHSGKSGVVMGEGALSRENDRYFSYSLACLIL